MYICVIIVSMIHKNILPSEKRNVSESYFFSFYSESRNFLLHNVFPGYNCEILTNRGKSGTILNYTHCEGTI